MPPHRLIAGIDEAGRGPLAGPVAVGMVVLPHAFDWAAVPGVGDSKQLTERAREAVYARVHEQGISYHVALISAQVIDTQGITAAVRAGIAECCAALAPEPEDTYVKLDGLLRAPAEYAHQITIIRGDASEREIGLASILAKVTRDRYMIDCDTQYPEYGFAQHKGYGTRAHQVALTMHGLSPEHRRSFCRRFVPTEE